MPKLRSTCWHRCHTAVPPTLTWLMTKLAPRSPSCRSVLALTRVASPISPQSRSANRRTVSTFSAPRPTRQTSATGTPRRPRHWNSSGGLMLLPPISVSFWIMSVVDHTIFVRHRQALLGPLAEAAGHRFDSRVTHLVQAVGGERRAHAAPAVEHDLLVGVGHEVGDMVFKNAAT